MPPLLELDDITKTFGGLTAVDSLSFSVNEGEILGLIGPNGAGKSTTFNLIVGALTPDSGMIRYRGEEIIGQSTYERVNSGLGRTYQTPQPFSELTVGENIRAATLPNKLTTARTRGRNADRIQQVATLVGLENDLDSFPDELTPGDLRRLEIARALATEPDLLLLDEVFAGVTHEEASELAALIETLRAERGYTFLVVDHVMDILMPLSDRVVAMSGEKLTEGTPEEVVTDEQVKSVYLGDSTDVGVADS